MQQYSGQLKTLGESISRGSASGWKYSYIEIGDHRLKNVWVSHGLNGVLREALGSDASISIWVVKFLAMKKIAGVSRPNGTVFRAKIKGVIFSILLLLLNLWMTFWTSSTFKSFLPAIPFVLMIFFGLYTLYVSFQALRIPADDVLG